MMSSNNHPKIIPNDKLTTYNLDSKTKATMRELKGELTELTARLNKEFEELTMKVNAISAQVVRYDSVLATINEALGKSV